MRTLFFALSLLGAAILPARAGVVTVTAPDDVRETPVSLLLPEATVKSAPAVTGADAISGQIEAAENGQVRLTFIARDLKKGVPRRFSVDASMPAVPGLGVEVKRVGENAEFWIGGKLFTRYDVTTGPNKPYFYPVFAPGNLQIVRHWPVEKTEGETTDHPHHRGLWFTHGKVNGVDFWTEKGEVGKTMHTAYDMLQSGPVYGLMRTRTNWVKPNGTKIAEDSRDIRVYDLNSGYVMDFAVTVKAVGGPLVFGDTKEGTFALRMADSMRAADDKGKPLAGHIINARGDKQAAAWGKAAEWCDYYGPVDGQTVGVAIFDDPKNPRHPTTWHVRDYGLFAVNPFGLHDFDKKNPAGAGDLTVPVGQSITFRYRLLFHKGTPDEARVVEFWQAFANPPAVRVE